MSKAALFLDRDGVINVDYAYVHKPENFHFIEGIFDLVHEAKTLGYLVIVVTNQAGIGRGYYSEADFYTLTQWMKERFLENNGLIDAVYFCPDHPEYGLGQYRRESEFRKPGPGMLLAAERDWDIHMAASIMVGDKLSDMQAARAAGVGTLLHLGGKDADGQAIVIKHLGQVLPYLKWFGD